MIYDGFLPTEREVGTKTFTNHSDKCSQKRSQPPSFIKIPFFFSPCYSKGLLYFYQLAISLLISNDYFEKEPPPAFKNITPTLLNGL